MLVDELSLWKCVYCNTQNDHTNWKCHECGKKKPKLGTVKRIISKRKKEAEQRKITEMQQNIEKVDNPPQDNGTELTFDLEKLSDNQQMPV